MWHGLMGGPTESGAYERGGNSQQGEGSYGGPNGAAAMLRENN